MLPLQDLAHLLHAAAGTGQDGQPRVGGHRLLHVEKKTDLPRDIGDYAITCDALPGLNAEVYDES